MYVNPGFVVIYTVVLRYVQGKSEFCSDDIFEAECNNDHVIVMKSANYGRMRAGRCVVSTEGNIGCQTDVIHLMDGWCSGRSSCSFIASRKELRQTKPCGTHWSYLEATFTCVKVMDSKKQQSCHDDKLLQNQVYLGNVDTGSLQCGSETSPWKLSAQVGQQIQVTLLDFGEPGRISPTLGFVNDDGHTYQIKNTDSKRDSLVYTSTENRLEVGFYSGSNDDPFILKFEAIGCPDLISDEGSWYTRERNTATFGCTFSKKSWKINCVDGAWTGVIGHCALIGNEGVTNTDIDIIANNEIPSSVLIAIIIGGLVLFCSIFLICILICVFKTKNSRKPNHQIVTKFPEDPYQYHDHHSVDYAQPEPQYYQADCQYRTARTNSRGEILDTGMEHHPDCNTLVKQ